MSLKCHVFSRYKIHEGEGVNTKPKICWIDQGPGPGLGPSNNWVGPFKFFASSSYSSLVLVNFF